VAAGSDPAWHVIDAEGQTLGRISSEIAVLLQGKHKPTYMSNLHMGDYVIVINADKVRVTGNKLAQKMYYRHSGYPGGIRQQTLQNVLDKKPTNAIKSAVKGMLPKTKLGRRMLSRLKLYAGGEHPHAAQVNARPKIVEAAAPAVAEQAAPPAEAAVKAPPAPKRRRASKPKAAAKEPVAVEQAEDAGAPKPEAPTPCRLRRTAASRTPAKASASEETTVEEVVALAEAAPEPDPPAPTRRRKAATKPAAEGAAGTPDEPAAKPPTARKKRASRAKPKSTDHQEE
jgi:large subunit ribosomal protein L13